MQTGDARMQDVKDAIAALYAAMLAHDLDALAALVDDQLIYIHSPGFAETRQAFLDGVRDGLYVYETVRPVSERVVVSGDLAVAYTVLDFAGGARGEPHPSITLLTTLAWRKRDGRWRLWLRQATRAVTSPGGHPTA